MVADRPRGQSHRRAKEVLTLADDLHERGIGLRILTRRLAGTYAPSGEGKFFFTMMAAFAELERDMLHERTMAGLAAARAPSCVRPPNTATASRASLPPPSWTASPTCPSTVDA